MKIPISSSGLREPLATPKTRGVRDTLSGKALRDFGRILLRMNGRC
jgi:hypothetical protein